MENKSETSTANDAYKRKLETPVSYSFDWTEYQTNDELVAAKDELTLDEQRKIRNNERKANARSKALKAALDAAGIVKPTAENDDATRLDEMVKTMMTAKTQDGSRKYASEEQAREVAAGLLGIDLATLAK